jgi:hypothetical protein
MKFRAIQLGLVFVLMFVVVTVAVFAGQASHDSEVRIQKVERTIAADPSVTVSICVMSGSISVQGWDKNEVSARSSDAGQIELRHKDPKDHSGKAVRVEVFVVDNSDDQQIKKNCQAYSDLQLFVPRPASVHVQTRDGDISIADIAVVVAGTQNGDISIERISQSVEVGSVGGSVFIRDSIGRASVTTIGGGIEASNLRPSSPGDGFEAVSVSGDLSLEEVSHSQFNARTVSGDVHLTGPLAARGRYGFKTLSGDITLTLPGDSSFQLNAKVSKDGEIISDFPLTLIPDVTPQLAPAPSVSDVSPKGPTAPEVHVVAPKRPSPAPAVIGTPPDSPAPPAANAVPKNPTPAPAAKPEGSPVIVKIGPRMGKVIVNTPVIVSPYTSRRVNAVCGGGDASIQVASFSGTLHLLKK